MKNLGNMMRQAQEMQQKLAELQRQLKEKDIDGAAGGGLVKITMNGRGEAKQITLDPKIVDRSDVPMLEDLIVAAINDARAKIEEHVESETRKAMGGVNLPPGVKLPF
jgi:DNA-binding YbaB/EbfC family protein